VSSAQRLSRCAASPEAGALGTAVGTLTASVWEGDVSQGAAGTPGAPSWVAPWQLLPRRAPRCCHCSGVFGAHERWLAGRAAAGSGPWVAACYAGGLVLEPLCPSVRSPPAATRLVACRRFPHLLSSGFATCCTVSRHLAWGMEGGGDPHGV